jgi:hypothetical protein
LTLRASFEKWFEIFDIISGMENLSHILLMKVGPYFGYSLEEIFKIKRKEEDKVGKFFWGYGGVFCRPRVVNSFVSYAKTNPTVLFTKTKSNFYPIKSNRFTSFSEDNLSWNPLDKKVLLIGNTGAPHFAVIMKNLRKIEFEINLDDYIPFTSKEMAPDFQERLGNYFRYRVDKACGIHRPSKMNNDNKLMKISYIAELVKPY